MVDKGDERRGRLRTLTQAALNADMTGWPPTILITGTRDLLLSPTVLTHRKLRAAGVRLGRLSPAKAPRDDASATTAC